MLTRTSWLGSIIIDLLSHVYEDLEFGLRYHPEMRLWEKKEDFLRDWQEAYTNPSCLKNTNLYLRTRGKEDLISNVFGSINSSMRWISPRIETIEEQFSALQRALIDDLTEPLPDISDLTRYEPRSSAPEFFPEYDCTSLSKFDTELITALPLLDYSDIGHGTDVQCSSSIPTYSTSESPTNEHQVDFDMEPETFAPGTPLKQLFRIDRSKEIVHPKKEYFRCQLIRVSKKSIRLLSRGKTPSSGINRLKTPAQQQQWEQLKIYYNQHHAELDAVSGTGTGLMTLRNEERNKKARSFNNRFCHAFFSTEVVRDFYYLVLDLIYIQAEPGELCEKMKVKCCMARRHSERCRDVWRDVYHYAKNGMLRELGVRNV